MRVAVVGAGTMGHGIAQVCAMAGWETTLHDVSAEILAEGIARITHNLAGGVERGKFTQADADAALERIRPVERLPEAIRAVDLVIEAVIEDLDIKRAMFANFAGLSPKAATLATNTSSLSIARIAQASSEPERVVGMHFFNPVHIMKLVEVVRHPRCAEEHVTRAVDAARALGKTPIVVKDSAGFASSRLGVVLGLEAMRMVEQGVASPEDIDTAMMLGYGHPMGPLRVSDLVGLDVRLAIAEYLYAELGDPHYAPPKILQDKVDAGELGKKTGKGFYEWDQK